MDSGRNLKNFPLPKCINCGGNHLATSHECEEVIKHKMVEHKMVTLASAENISIVDAKRFIRTSRSLPPSQIRQIQDLISINILLSPKHPIDSPFALPLLQDPTDSLLTNLSPHSDGINRRFYLSVSIFSVTAFRPVKISCPFRFSLWSLSVSLSKPHLLTTFPLNLPRLRIPGGTSFYILMIVLLSKVMALRSLRNSFSSFSQQINNQFLICSLFYGFK